MADRDSQTDLAVALAAQWPLVMMTHWWTAVLAPWCPPPAPLTADDDHTLPVPEPIERDGEHALFA
ncbi:hypothetical protein ACG3SL_06055 [Sphingomonas sp. CJ20]